MKKNHTGKILAVMIIVLFMGVSVSSGFAVDAIQSIRENQNEKCSDCRDLRNTELIKVKGLLNRVEVYSSLLIVLSKYNHKFEINYQDLSNQISNIVELIDNNIYENICNLLWGIAWCFVPFAYPLFLIMENSPENSLRYLIASFLFDIISNIQYIFLQLIIFLKCDQISYSM